MSESNLLCFLYSFTSFLIECQECHFFEMIKGDISFFLKHWVWFKYIYNYWYIISLLWKEISFFQVACVWWSCRKSFAFLLLWLKYFSNSWWDIFFIFQEFLFYNTFLPYLTFSAISLLIIDSSFLSYFAFA